MSLSALSTLKVIAAESAGEPAVHPWAVGAITLGILLFLLLVLVSVGGGREHS